jgi:hypothetical protein
VIVKWHVFAYFVTFGHFMELRSHPLMSFQGFSNWPPKWTSTSGKPTIHPSREIGVLEQVKRSSVNPATCFLMISHGGDFYIGRLNFDDPNFCRQVSDLLTAHYGRSLAEIGAIDIPYTP